MSEEPVMKVAVTLVDAWGMVIERREIEVEDWIKELSHPALEGFLDQIEARIKDVMRTDPADGG